MGLKGPGHVWSGGGASDVSKVDVVEGHAAGLPSHPMHRAAFPGHFFLRLLALHLLYLAFIST